jgi:hypothetical protein
MLAVAFASAERNCSTEMSSLRRDPQSRCLSRLVEARSAERQILREGQVVYVGKDSDPQSVRRHHSAAVRTVIDGGSQARARCAGRIHVTSRVVGRVAGPSEANPPRALEVSLTSWKSYCLNSAQRTMDGWRTYRRGTPTKSRQRPALPSSNL